MPTPLPIDPHLPCIIESLRQHRALVLVAEPGAGKTTRVPPAILRAGLLPAEHPNLVLLQPRRVAARAAAMRIAQENGWQVGGEVGWHVRFDRHIGPRTRLRVLTEGILTRQLVDDPFQEPVGAVVLDEFHERSIHTDLAIALLAEIRQTVREDLVLIVMSATLDAEPVARFLGRCPIVNVPGRTFPIEVVHAAAPSAKELPQRVAEALESSSLSPYSGRGQGRGASAGDRRPANGDILVFLPGVEEIRRTMRALAPIARRDDLLTLPLHGSLPPEEQVRALAPAPGGRRKLILATNIAETSLTIEGVTSVIDSGLARVAGYDAERGLDRLDLKRISKASATQRAGRAGRTAPGRCFRLYTARDFAAMADFELPEVRRVDLAQTALALHAWGKPDLRGFGWYDPPPEETLAAAERLLAMLGALDAETNGRITPLGKRMVALPVHPRLARLLLAAADGGLLEAGATVAALLAEKDIATVDYSAHPSQRGPATQGVSDLLIRMDLLAAGERGGFSSAQIDPAAARQVLRTRDELVRVARSIRRSHPRSTGVLPAVPGRCPHPDPLPKYRDRGKAAEPAPAALSPGSRARDEAILRFALLAYPDRVCRRRSADPATATMVGGGGVRLAAESVVRRPEFFVALDARRDDRSAAREALVRIASGIEIEWLEEYFPHEIRRQRRLVYDPQRQRVVGLGTTMYRDLLLREDRDAPVDAAAAGEVLAEALAPRAAQIITASEPAARLLARIDLLRRHLPEHRWPAFGAEDLAEVLGELSRNKRGLEELERTSPVPYLMGRLPYPLDRLLDEHAPETITVPTGNRIRVTYSPGQPPVLAVRLQELFGWTDTPRIAAGRVPVVLHLLGPNFRPVQITDDLRSFWSNAYFQVRKDLRVRYPKHSWPEDPLTAKPEAKGGRRSM